MTNKETPGLPDRVAEIMALVDKCIHAEAQLMSGPFVYGDAYERKKEPIRAMRAELRNRLRGELGVVVEPVAPILKGWLRDLDDEFFSSDDGLFEPSDLTGWTPLYAGVPAASPGHGMEAEGEKP